MPRSRISLAPDGSRRFGILLALLAAGGCRGCDRGSAAVHVEAASVSAAGSQKAASPSWDGAISKRPITTSASIAWGNLDGDIDARRKKNRTLAGEHLHLVELLLLRSQMRGSIADAEEAEVVANGAVQALPNAWEPWFARALVRGAMHRFDDEEKDLGEAERRAGPLGPSPRIAGARATILLARGRYDEAKALEPANIRERDSTEIAHAAVLAARMQKPDEAEELFELARTKLDSVSPFPLAFMDFQRASVLEAQGKDVQARAYFAEICDFLPSHAHAAVHLAPSMPADQAIALLTPLRATSGDDPDVLAALAQAHQRAGHESESKALVETAKKKFDELVAKHREAYADHAARFWLGAGRDPAKALPLARDNAKLRPTEEALDLWMAAAAATNERAELCAATTAMKQLPYASEKTRRLAAGVECDAGVH